MALLTIFTPAYNRAHTIRRTYESLCRQTCKNFEWLVIDDGSTDNTREVVAGFIEENIIPIRYIYQHNQGMHGAHNTAYENITTELNTCIDSDDWMPDNAVQLICEFWEKNRSEDVAGIIGLDCKDNGELIGTSFPAELRRTTLEGFYLNGGRGDKKLVYRTDVIKKYPPYPLFEGERYVGLAYKYMLVDKDYEMIVINKPLAIVEYQDDGSSVNMYRQYWNNPKGFSFFRKTEMVCSSSVKRRFVSCIHYVASSIISSNKHFVSESPKKLMTLAALPFGVLWYAVIRHNVKSNAKMKIG